MNSINLVAIFGIVFLSSILLVNGIYSNQIFAQENQTGTNNEAEIEADIEQENKCKKDTECENENEINNSLNILTQNVTQSQEKPQSETTLEVAKVVNCSYTGQEGDCPNEFFTEADFLITVTGNNPSPSEFPGNFPGTLVTIGAGDYTVSEITEIITQYDIVTTFSEDCTQVGPTQSEGTIADGETQRCIITNTFLINDT